ncbi:UNVERIFIED_CONTAM: Methylesterase 10 [Sesamum calycinum]|uniref:Methylesterase 10 n=1 Tax=Sesamum calycinum TaxID=2727403 RepID=A0AAW2LU57_9LAMI
MVENSEKKHFVLVHGLSHGAWCWYKLVSLLKLQGHKVTALDLGGCGLHPKQLHQISSISDYIQPLLDFLAALPDDQTVILVGHSYGGIPISLAMENFPGKISVAVFVSAYMPNCSDPPTTLIQEDLELAKTMVRPSLIFLEELSKTCLLSEERYGAVKRCYVICEEDEVMEEEFQRYIIEKSPPEDVVSIAGAGHMIMLAKPQELCSCLTELIS